MTWPPAQSRLPPLPETTGHSAVPGWCQLEEGDTLGEPGGRAQRHFHGGLRTGRASELGQAPLLPSLAPCTEVLAPKAGSMARGPLHWAASPGPAQSLSRPPPLPHPHLPNTSSQTGGLRPRELTAASCTRVLPRLQAITGPAPAPVGPEAFGSVHQSQCPWPGRGNPKTRFPYRNQLPGSHPQSPTSLGLRAGPQVTC